MQNPCTECIKAIDLIVIASLDISSAASRQLAETLSARLMVEISAHPNRDDVRQIFGSRFSGGCGRRGIS